MYKMQESHHTNKAGTEAELANMKGTIDSLNKNVSQSEEQQLHYANIDAQNEELKSQLEEKINLINEFEVNLLLYKYFD